MKYLDNGYGTVFCHKGIDIGTLKVACPAKGDGMGYAIDHPYFRGRNYNELVAAITEPDEAVKTGRCSARIPEFHGNRQPDTEPEGEREKA